MELHLTHETPPPPGHAIEVAPNVRWLRMPLPFALDHVNLWLIGDGPAWTAVDTGIALDTVKEAWKRVLAGHRLSRLVVTHFHPDHLGLAAWLEREAGAPLWTTQGEYTTALLVKEQVGNYSIAAMNSFFRQHGLGAAGVAGLEKRGNAYARGVPEIPLTFRRLFDGDRLTIGEHRWRIIAGFGHSPEHASLYCEDLHVLISGDMLLPRITTNISAYAAAPDADPLGDYLDSLDGGFGALPDDTLVLPAHGMPFRGLHARIAQLHAHHEERCNVLLDACANTPQSAADLLPTLFGRDIADPHQKMFAMGEAIAHLIYLEKKRALTRIIDAGGIRFVRISQSLFQ